MNYETINLQEKIVACLTARTKNSDPDMGAVIGGLWQRFYEPDVYSTINNRVSEKAVCIYSEYESDCNSEYSVSVGCEVGSANQISENMVCKKIPAGKYARFVVKGNMQQIVADFWQKLWQMQDLQRTYVCDFEEYQNSDMENAEVHFYISIK